MSTTSASITVRGIGIDVVYKDIKNLHIAVYPPTGRVRVAAPSRLNEDHIRLAVIQRLSWIKRRQRQLQDAVRETPREMVTGESHYVWGYRHRLKVIERPGRPHIEVAGERLQMFVPPGTTTDRRRKLLHDWQRQEMRLKISALIDEWQPRLGTEVSRWSIRRMKTKWGSCNRDTGHVCLNLELARTHPLCLEYVVVHEMVHLLERNHTERFYALLTDAMPLWAARRDQLNQSPLGHQEWQV